MSKLQNWSQILEHILGSLQSMQTRRISPEITRFCYHLVLVTVGVRSGYLCDPFSFSAKDPAAFYAVLLQKLRLSPLFNDLNIILEDCFGGQVFFINMALLKQRLQLELDSPQTIFVLLSTPAEIVPMPQAVRDVLTQLQALLSDEVHTLPTQLTLEALVPLSGLLLEYPVSYVPLSAEQTIFLSDVALEIFECIIFIPKMKSEAQIDEHDEHLMFNFSCPTGLVGKLATQSITNRLQAHFPGRLPASDMRIEIRHHVEILGNVAF